MAMTKKDFQEIANIIRGNRPTRLGSDDFDSGYIYGLNVALANVTDELADYFRSINPDFDEARFREACE